MHNELRCQVEAALPAFFAAFYVYVASLIQDRWIWGEYADGAPCVLHNTLSEDTSQAAKDEYVAHILHNYAGVVKCNEWVQMSRYTTIDGVELAGPVNVLVQSWEYPQEDSEATARCRQCGKDDLPLNVASGLCVRCAIDNETTSQAKGADEE